MRRMLRAALCSTIAMLGGCEGLYGVETIGALRTPPDMTCLLAAVRDTPGVTSAALEGGNDNLRPRAPREPPAAFSARISYSDGQYFAWLDITRAKDGVRYWNGNRSMSHKPRPVYASYPPIMRAVNNNVATRCGVSMANAVEVPPAR